MFNQLFENINKQESRVSFWKFKRKRCFGIESQLRGDDGSELSGKLAFIFSYGTLYKKQNKNKTRKNI